MQFQKRCKKKCGRSTTYCESENGLIFLQNIKTLIYPHKILYEWVSCSIFSYSNRIGSPKPPSRVTFPKRVGRGNRDLFYCHLSYLQKKEVHVDELNLWDCSIATDRRSISLDHNIPPNCVDSISSTTTSAINNNSREFWELNSWRHWVVLFGSWTVTIKAPGGPLDWVVPFLDHLTFIQDSNNITSRIALSLCATTAAVLLPSITRGMHLVAHHLFSTSVNDSVNTSLNWVSLGWVSLYCLVSTGFFKKRLILVLDRRKLFQLIY